jgi:hypothetical protein
MQRVPTSVVLRALRTPLESHHRPATMLATTTTPFASRATRTSSKTAARVVASARRSSTASSPSPSSLPKIVANASPFLPRASGRDETGDPSPSSSQQQRGGEDEPDRDEDGLYIGTYSNFFTDPDQIKGVIIFCAFLASFLSLGNIGAAILLPILYDQPMQTCIQGILFGYYCPP